MASWSRSLCALPVRYTVVEGEGTLKKEGEQIILAGKMMLWVSNLGSAEYCI